MAAWMAAAASAPDRAGVFVDFDGTLAPIVDDPGSARPWPGIPDLLGRLAARLARVAVVSGRPVSYLDRELAGAGRTELLGLYGLEHAGPGGPATRPEAEPWRAAVTDVAAEAERSAPAGVAVERKGLTVTVHYRADPLRRQWVEDFAAAAARRTGLEAHTGKMSVELRPPVSIDKGTVVGELSDGLGAVLFAGDDRGDLPAFAELGRLRAAGVHTLAVASGGAETPAEVIAAADVTVEGPAGVVSLLERLLR